MIIIVSLTFTKKEPFKDNKEAIYFWVVVIACYGWFVILKRMGLCKSLPNEWNKNYWLFKGPSLWIGKAAEKISVTMEHAQYDRFNESNI